MICPLRLAFTTDGRYWPTMSKNLGFVRVGSSRALLSFLGQSLRSHILLPPSFSENLNPDVDSWLSCTYTSEWTMVSPGCTLSAISPISSKGVPAMKYSILSPTPPM